MGTGIASPLYRTARNPAWWAGIYSTVGWRRSAMWAALTKRNQNTSYDCNGTHEVGSELTVIFETCVHW